MDRGKICFMVFMLFMLSSCTGHMAFIPRTGGQFLTANYQDGMGQTTISVVLPSGETLKGDLIWLPPGGGLSSTLVTTGQGTGVVSGVSSGNKGMYVGSIIGDRGTAMRIELLCNVWTGKCVGTGQTSKGDIYDIQR